MCEFVSLICYFHPSTSGATRVCARCPPFVGEERQVPGYQTTINRVATTSIPNWRTTQPGLMTRGTRTPDQVSVVRLAERYFPSSRLEILIKPKDIYAQTHVVWKYDQAKANPVREYVPLYIQVNVLVLSSTHSFKEQQ